MTGLIGHGCRILGLVLGLEQSVLLLLAKKQTDLSYYILP